MSKLTSEKFAYLIHMGDYIAGLNNLEGIIAQRDLEIVKPWREALENIRRATKEAQDCANGTKVHNPDGEGDEMCEEGICYSTSWEDILEWCDALLSTAVPASQEE